MAIKLDCIQKGLEAVFYKHGKLVSRYPLPFLIVPIVLTVGLAIGVINMNRIDDMEYLYAPVNGAGQKERSLFEEIFPQNDSHFYNPTRKTNVTGYCQIIITDKSGGNIYTETHMKSIIQFNDDLISLNINVGEESITYEDVCSKWKGQCVQNNWLMILNGNASTITTTKISYPIHNQLYFLGFQLGGVELDSNGHIISAKALFLAYDMKFLTPKDIALTDKWSEKASVYLLSYNPDNITVDFFVTHSLNDAIEGSLATIIPRFSIAFTVLITFCVLTCLMFDWVRSKTLVAIGGVVSAGMAIVTTLGLLSAAGVQFTSVVGIMPFLIIGIGVDDMFVILSAWRHTSYTLSVEERMGLTFKTAAISITVTSVTDALAFLVGSLSSFRAVTLLCAWTGVAVIFSYVYAITFLAAVFVYSGRREAANRHEATCKKILPKKEAGDKSMLYKFFCTGGYIEEDYQTSQDTDKIDLPWFSEFMRDIIAPFLVKIPVKIIVMVLYCCYLAVSIWGVLEMKEGLQLQNLAPDGSHVIPFYLNLKTYFNSKYGYRVMFAYTDPLDYSNPVVRQNIFSQVDSIRQNPSYYNESIYYEFWLPNYLSYLQMTSQPVPTDMQTFIYILRTQFLQIPQFEQFKLDVIFNSNYTEITASRFLLQSKGVVDALEERTLMLDSRKLSEEAVYNMSTFYPLFVYFDQYTVIVWNTGQNIGIALASMLLVALLLLPSIISALWVTVSVISILIGVIGFMVFWDVSLDSISMINIVICIGYSVDFSAHVSYHFCISKKSTGNERAIDTLSHLGTPIVQAAISTILGAIVLSTSGSYIFRTFFKLILLVMLFGLAHALFILPVVLSVFGPQNCCNKKEQNKDTEKVNKTNQRHKGDIKQDHVYSNEKFKEIENWNVIQNRMGRNQFNEHSPYISTVYVVP